MRGYPLQRLLKLEGGYLFSFFILIWFVRELYGPDVLIRLDAFSTDLLFGRFSQCLNPNDSEQRPLVLVLNFYRVANLQLTPEASEPDAVLGRIERMCHLRFVAVVDSCEPYANRHHHLGSLLAALACSEPWHKAMLRHLGVDRKFICIQVAACWSSATTMIRVLGR